jgi:hypothetical protein
VVVFYLEHADIVGVATCVKGCELQPHAPGSVGKH